jgi:GNAT superfamily N-acetyltransferase
VNITEFLEPISEAELREVYWIDHSRVSAKLQIINNENTKLRLELLTRTADGNKLIYSVSLYAGESEPVFLRDLQRWLCDNKLCLGEPRERSRVAVRVGFFLRSAFQRAGLASYILPREEDAFRKWGAREVQLLAIDDGRWVWARPRYGYTVDVFEFQTLQEKYKEWQRAQGATSIRRAPDLSALPENFLRTEVSCLNLFKEL